MRKYLLGIIALCLLLLGLTNFTYSLEATDNRNPSDYYQHHAIHSRDGIGKFYKGREIAKVMGHQEMLWLERPSRASQEMPDHLVEALDLKPNAMVADIGAGTGYFSFRLASAVPQGKVLAVDIQPQMLEAVDFLKAENQVTNVETILSTAQNPRLPAAAVDLVLMVDAYHEFEYPREMMEAIVKALKPGGRVVLVEYRRENPLIPIKTLHKMTQRQIKKEMAAVGLIWQQTQNFLPQQHLMVFQRNNNTLI